MDAKNFKYAYENQGQPSINGVIVINNQGPWNSRSGGKLMLPLMLDEKDALEKFLAYEKIRGSKISGLRIYTLKDIPKNGAGDYEFHIYRRKFIMSIRGATEWECEDVNGSRKTFIIDEMTSILIPPFVLHKYKALQDTNSFLALCNTTFDANNKDTQDTYRQAEFLELQASLA